MKAISLYEPWASFVIWGWKTIETRTHTRFRNLVDQTIAIHATKKLDDGDAFYPYLLSSQKEIYNMAVASGVFKKNAGKVMGTVKVLRFAALSGKSSFDSLIDCGSGPIRYGLFLDESIKLFTPFNYKGSQGIFDIPDDLITEAMKRRCRKCLCTEDDCRSCIERTGQPCYWVEADLCSACVEVKNI